MLYIWMLLQFISLESLIASLMSMNHLLMNTFTANDYQWCILGSIAGPHHNNSLGEVNDALNT